MEGFGKQGLRRYAHGRRDVCDRGAVAGGSIVVEALRIVVVTVARQHGACGADAA